MAPSYHSKLRTRESHFSFVWEKDFSIIYPCLDKAKVSTVNYNLANLVDIQRLHENIKLTICGSNGFYTLLTKDFSLFRTSL